MTSISPSQEVSKRPWFKWKLNFLSELVWIFISSGVCILLYIIFPEEEADWAHTQIVAWIIFSLIFLSFIFQTVSKSFIIFSARNIILLGIIYWVLTDVLQMIPNIYTLTPEAALQAILYIFVGVIFLQIGYLISPNRWLRKRFIVLKDPKAPYFSFLIICSAFIAGLLPDLYWSNWSLSKLIENLLGSRSIQSIIEGRGSVLGNEKAFFTSLTFFMLAFPSMVAFYLVSFKKHLFKKFFLVLCLITVWFIQFCKGTRQFLGFVILSPAFVIYLSLSKKMKKWFLVFMTIAFVCLFYLMEVQVQQRDKGFFDIESILTIDKVKSGAAMTVDDNFVQFARVTTLVPSKFPYVYFDELLRLLILPVPRAIWEGKPKGFGYDYVRSMLGFVHLEGFSITYSVFGDFYVSYGLLGIILGSLFLGWLARNLDQVIPFLGSNKVGLVLFALYVFTFWMTIRATQNFVIFSYYTMAFIFIMKIASFSLRK